MPVYEYDCKSCAKRVGVLVRGAEGDPPTCPRCGGSDLRRLVSGFAFHRSLRSKVEQLDPKYEKMVDSANPDLSMESLTKRYGLDKPPPQTDKE